MSNLFRSQHGGRASYQPLNDEPMGTLNVKIPKVAIAAIETCLDDEESKASFVREAICRELLRRNPELKDDIVL